ncbi:hypothetical protein Droror1_Dr00024578 [Drosera rotundifolia]
MSSGEATPVSISGRTESTVLVEEEMKEWVAHVEPGVKAGTLKEEASTGVSSFEAVMVNRTIDPELQELKLLPGSALSAKDDHAVATGRGPARLASLGCSVILLLLGYVEPIVGLLLGIFQTEESKAVMKSDDGSRRRAWWRLRAAWGLVGWR